MSEPRSQTQTPGHRYALKRLSSYMDGQLSEREHTRVQAHLKGCSACRDELHSLRWTQSLAQEMPRVPVPRSFVVREADLETRRVRQPRPRFARSLAGMQAAAAIIAVLLVLVVAGDIFVARSLLMGGAAPVVSMHTPQTEAAFLATPEEVLASPTDEQPTATTESGTPQMMAQAVPSETPSPAQTPTSAGAPAQVASTRKSPTPPPEVRTPITGTDQIAVAPKTVELEDQGTEDHPIEERVAEESQVEERVAEGNQVEEPTGSTWMAKRRGQTWRVAQIGLGAVLLGLLIAIVWLRLKRRFG